MSDEFPEIVLATLAIICLCFFVHSEHKKRNETHRLVKVEQTNKCKDLCVPRDYKLVDLFFETDCYCVEKNKQLILVDKY